MGCHETGRQPDGQPGPVGAAAAAGNTGAVGGAGIGSVTPLSWDLLASRVPIRMATRQLHRAELEYLAERVDSSSRILTFLERVAAAGTRDQGEPEQIEWAAILSRTRALLAQMTAGLDYYGLTRNFVPLVTLDAYKDVIRELLRLGTHIEQTHDRYWAEEISAEAKLRELDEAFAASSALVLSARTELTKLNQNATAAQDSVRLLAQALDSQERALRDGDVEFREAVAANAGCDFGEVLKFVSTVVSVGRAVAGDVTAIVGAIAPNAVAPADRPQVGAGLRGIVDTVKVVRGGIEDMRTQYHSIRNLIDAERDAAKLIVTRDDFERQLEPYLALPAALRYRERLRLFVATAQSMNQKTLEHTSLRIAAQSSAAEIARREAEVARVRTATVAARDPSISECVTFMRRLLDQAKTDLVRALHSESRAYEFWALEEQRFVFDDRNMAALESTHARILALELAAMERRNGAASAFHGIEVRRTIEQLPEQFAALTRGEKVAIAIDETEVDFEDIASVAVTEAVVRLEGVVPRQRPIRLTLTHSGRSRFRTEDGSIREYTHRPRTASLRFRVGNPDEHLFDTTNNLGGQDGRYADISPFSVWFLEIPSQLNDADLSGVRALTIVFKGHFRSLQM